MMQCAVLSPDTCFTLPACIPCSLAGHVLAVALMYANGFRSDACCMHERSPAMPPWETLHGLLDNAIYGGRIDNEFDQRILRTCLQVRACAKTHACCQSFSPLVVVNRFHLSIHRRSIDNRLAKGVMVERDPDARCVLLSFADFLHVVQPIAGRSSRSPNPLHAIPLQRGHQRHPRCVFLPQCNA